MREHSLELTPLQQDYIEAFRLAKSTWYGLRTDDELYRIADREEYVEKQVTDAFPHIPHEHAVWLGEIANKTVLEQLDLYFQ